MEVINFRTINRLQILNKLCQNLQIMNCSKKRHYFNIQNTPLQTHCGRGQSHFSWSPCISCNTFVFRSPVCARQQVCPISRLIIVAKQFDFQDPGAQKARIISRFHERIFPTPGFGRDINFIYSAGRSALLIEGATKRRILILFRCELTEASVRPSRNRSPGLERPYRRAIF